MRLNRRLVVKLSPKTAQTMHPNLEGEKAAKPGSCLLTPKHARRRLRNPWIQIAPSSVFAPRIAWKMTWKRLQKWHTESCRSRWMIPLKRGIVSKTFVLWLALYWAPLLLVCCTDTEVRKGILSKELSIRRSGQVYIVTKGHKDSFLFCSPDSTEIQP